MLSMDSPIVTSVARECRLGWSSSRTSSNIVSKNSLMSISGYRFSRSSEWDSSKLAAKKNKASEAEEK